MHTARRHICTDPANLSCARGTGPTGWGSAEGHEFLGVTEALVAEAKASCPEEMKSKRIQQASSSPGDFFFQRFNLNRFCGVIHGGEKCQLWLKKAYIWICLQPDAWTDSLPLLCICNSSSVWWKSNYTVLEQQLVLAQSYITQLQYTHIIDSPNAYYK